MLKKVILNNFFWQILDKLILLILQFLVGIKIANYFGKEIYGIFSYALSLVLFSGILYEIINKKIVIIYFLKKRSLNFLKIVSSFRSVLSILFFILILVSKNFFQDFNLYIILLFLLFSEVFKNLYFFYEVYYEANLNSKPFIIITNIIKIISYIFQYFFIFLFKDIKYIALVLLVENIIKLISLKIFFFNVYKEEIKERKFNFKYYRLTIMKIIRKSFNFWIGTIYFLIFTQIDKIMIGNMLNKSEVGVYSVAVQLINVLGILIIPIQNTLFPILLRNKDKKSYIEDWLYYNTIITYLYLILILFSFPILNKLFLFVFSKEYIGAIQIYYILSIYLFFKANSCLRISYMTSFNLGKLIIKLSVLGVFFNIFLNYMFIKTMGMNGAAIATVITQILTGNLFYYIFKNGKIITIVQLKSLNLKKIWRKK